MKATALIPIVSLALSFQTAQADHPTLTLEDGSPGPITTISAAPLPRGMVSAAAVSQFVFFDALSDAELLRHAGEEDIVHSTDRVVSASLNSAYGVTDDLTLGFSLPYLWRTNLREVAGGHVGGAEGREERAPRHGGEDHGGDDDAPPTVERVGDSLGVGDATLYAQYRFWNDGTSGRSVALLAGLKTPTGRTDVLTSSGAPLEAHHQPGSGSWDPLLGFAYTRGMGRWSFDASALYSFATDGVYDSNLGDVFNYNAAVSYRAIGARVHEEHDHGHGHGHGHDHGHDHGHGHGHGEASSHGHPTTLDLILEANGDWRGKVVESGDEDGNTGGNIVFLSGGARLSWGCGWAATVSAGAPALKDLNGIQSEPDLRLLFGVSKAF